MKKFSLLEERWIPVLSEGRVKEVGRVFGEGQGAFRVELDAELGVVYVMD